MQASVRGFPWRQFCGEFGKWELSHFNWVCLERGGADFRRRCRTDCSFLTTGFDLADQRGSDPMKTTVTLEDTAVGVNGRRQDVLPRRRLGQSERYRRGPRLCENSVKHGRCRDKIPPREAPTRFLSAGRPPRALPEEVTPRGSWKSEFSNSLGRLDPGGDGTVNSILWSEAGPLPDFETDMRNLQADTIGARFDFGVAIARSGERGFPRVTQLHRPWRQSRRGRMRWRKLRHARP